MRPVRISFHSRRCRPFPRSLLRLRLNESLIKLSFDKQKEGRRRRRQKGGRSFEKRTREGNRANEGNGSDGALCVLNAMSGELFWIGATHKERAGRAVSITNTQWCGINWDPVHSYSGSVGFRSLQFVVVVMSVTDHRD